MKRLLTTLTVLSVVAGAVAPASAGTVKVSKKWGPAAGYSNNGEFGSVIGPRVRSDRAAKVMINPQPLPPSFGTRIGANQTR